MNQPKPKFFTPLDYFEMFQNTNLEYSIQYGTGDKHLVVVGGTHGNEPAGVEAIMQYHKYLVKTNASIDGKITFLVGNPQAYNQYLQGDLTARYVDTDLNRAFGQESFGLEMKRAEEIATFLKETSPDVVLDLHSVSKGNTRMIAYKDNPLNQDLARKVSPLDLIFAFKEEHLPGSLNGYCTDLGIPSIAIECGNHESTDSITQALTHISLLAQHLELTKTSKYNLRVLPNRREYTTFKKIVPGKNFRFLKDYYSEDLIPANEVYAVDDNGWRSEAKDLYIMMPSKNPKETDVDAGFLCVRL